MCPCGSSQSFESCCEPYIKGTALPPTAEKLMRSRYTAFTVADVDYIKKTLSPEARKGFNATETLKWAQQAKWKKLTILGVKKGTEEDTKGIVEFSAFYEIDGEDIQLHEIAEFKKENSGQWLYVDGDAHAHRADEDVASAHAKKETIVRKDEKIGRNDPCSCGSGKKYKKCCAV